MRYFFGLLAAVALVAGGTKVAYDRFESEIETRASVAIHPTGTTLPSVLPATGQVVVAGVIAHLHIESALLDPLPMPLTVTTPQRGLDAGGTFTGISVSGHVASIHWDAGTPLQLSAAASGGSLAIGAVTVDLDGTTTTVSFGDLPQGITPGPYSIGSPVAVSQDTGLAKPFDSVSFDAGPTATVSFTGGATSAFPSRAMTIKGPGKVVLTGDLALVHPDKSQTKVTSVTLDTGPFTVKIIPSKGGTRVEATLQGAVSST